MQLVRLTVTGSVPVEPMMQITPSRWVQLAAEAIIIFLVQLCIVFYLVAILN